MKERSKHRVQTRCFGCYISQRYPLPSIFKMLLLYGLRAVINGIFHKFALYFRGGRMKYNEVENKHRIWRADDVYFSSNTFYNMWYSSSAKSKENASRTRTSYHYRFMCYCNDNFRSYLNLLFAFWKNRATITLIICSFDLTYS